MRDLINKLSLIESTDVNIPKIFSRLTSDRELISFGVSTPALNYHDWDENDASLHHLTVNRMYLSSSNFYLDKDTGWLAEQERDKGYVHISLLIEGKATDRDMMTMLQYTELQEVCRKTIANAGFGNAMAQKLDFHNEWIVVPTEFAEMINAAYQYGQSLDMSPPNHLAGDDDS